MAEQQPHPIYARIVGTGSFLPPRCVSNPELVSLLAKDGIETSDEWITERTGIKTRHFADDNTHTSDLALGACKRALAAAGITAADVDLIVVATTTPDCVFPSTACILQRKLGNIGAAAFDVQAVCTGFIYALTIANALIKTGSARTALVVGAEKFTRLMDFQDRTTCVLFGDGAGAVVLQASNETGILASDLHADGSQGDVLCVTGHLNKGALQGSPFIHMDGPAVFKLAVSSLAQTAQSTLEKAGKTAADIDWLVPHQANSRIIASTVKKLHLDMRKVIVTVQDHGNTSAASIPLALDTAVKNQQIKKGHTLLLEGVGGGFTWGSVLLVF